MPRVPTEMGSGEPGPPCRKITTGASARRPSSVTFCSTPPSS